MSVPKELQFVPHSPWSFLRFGLKFDILDFSEVMFYRSIMDWLVPCILLVFLDEQELVGFSLRRFALQGISHQLLTLHLLFSTCCEVMLGSTLSRINMSEIWRDRKGGRTTPTVIYRWAKNINRTHLCQFKTCRPLLFNRRVVLFFMRTPHVPGRKYPCHIFVEPRAGSGELVTLSFKRLGRAISPLPWRYLVTQSR